MSLLSKLKTISAKVAQKTPEQNHPSPENTPYQLIGGEKGTRALAERFYDIMATAEQAKELLSIHPQPMESIRQRFFEYLSGWLGGPALFESQYGHPRLRARHLPYKVTTEMRDQWMFCMEGALEDVVENRLLAEGLRRSFQQLADHMVNTEKSVSQERVK